MYMCMYIYRYMCVFVVSVCLLVLFLLMTIMRLGETANQCHRSEQNAGTPSLTGSENPLKKHTVHVTLHYLVLKKHTVHVTLHDLVLLTYRRNINVTFHYLVPKKHKCHFTLLSSE